MGIEIYVIPRRGRFHASMGDGGIASEFTGIGLNRQSAIGRLAQSGKVPELTEQLKRIEIMDDFHTPKLKFHVCIPAEPGYHDVGDTPEEAIGNLLLTHPEIFGLDPCIRLFYELDGSVMMNPDGKPEGMTFHERQRDFSRIDLDPEPVYKS